MKKKATKTVATLYMDAEVWELVKKKHPRGISKLTEDYYRSTLNVELEDVDNKEIDQIEKETKELDEEISKLRIKKKSMEIEKSKKEQAKKEEEAKKLEDQANIVWEG
jgi:cell division protein FtsB|tara:strand:+ start:24858 stop:25181 length:324 start_codon:yes stop_codon:yes gene_type:complete